MVVKRMGAVTVVGTKCLKGLAGWLGGADRDTSAAVVEGKKHNDVRVLAREAADALANLGSRPSK